MKKKLSLLLALVFIFTIVFGILPGPNAEATHEQGTGSLTVVKELADGSDTPDDPNQWFEITVKFINSGQTISNDITYASVNGLSAEVQQNDIFKIKLQIGQQGIFTGIPTGTWYYVEELSLSTGWEEPSYESEGHNGDGDTGTDGKGKIVNAGTEDSVIVKNKYKSPYGTLTISKEVTDNGPSGVQFPITVTFENEAGLGAITNDKSIPESTTEAGTYAFTLTDGGSIVFSKIPTGTTYYVVEDLTPDQKTAGWEFVRYVDETTNDDNVTHGTGTIVNAGAADTVTVQNKYIYGMLEVKKVIETDNAPAGAMFPITVKFEDGTDLTKITNTAGISPVDGIYSLSLAHGDSVMFYGIPDDTKYDVKETIGNLETGWALEKYTDYDYSNGNSKYDGNGKIESGKIDTVTVKNKYTLGMLTVTKEITDGAPTNVPFPVKVTFSNADDYSTITNSKGVSAGEPGIFMFDLYGGESIVFYGIPDGTVYTYSEDLSNTNYEKAGWSFNGYDDEDYGSGDKHDDGRGKIDFGGECNDSDAVKLINKYNDPGTGKLKLTKLLTSDYSHADPGAVFNVYVTFSNNNPFVDLSGIMLGASPVNFEVSPANTVKVTLAAGDSNSAVFTNIPVGTAYTVSEPSTPGFWVYSNTWCDDSEANNSPAPYYTIDSKNDIDTVKVTNAFVPSGSLDVTKLITGEGASSDESFTIDVTFFGEEIDLTGIMLNGSTVSFNEGTTTVTLALTGDDTAMFTNIPLGVSYTVDESGILANWSQVSIMVNGTAYDGDETYSFYYTNVEDNHLSDVVVITNDYTPPGTPPPPPFFPPNTPPTTPSESPSPTPSESPSPEPSTGVAGASDDGSSSDDGNQGSVAGDSDVLPQTGGISTSTLLGIFGLALIAIGGTALTIFKKRVTGKNKDK